MKAHLIILFALSITAHAQQGEIKREPQKLAQLTTLKGVTFTNVQVLKVSALDIRIMHDGGAATIKQTDLPEDARKFFGYDADLAAQEMQKQEQQRASIAAEQAKQRETTAAIEAEQRAQHAEINKHEEKGVKMRVHIKRKVGSVLSANAWRVNVLEDPKRKDFSGRPIKIEVNEIGPPASVELHGFSASENDVFVAILYPVDIARPNNRRYAHSPDLAWRLSQTKRP